VRHPVNWIMLAQGPIDRKGIVEERSIEPLDVETESGLAQIHFSGFRLSGGEVLGTRNQKQGDDEGELETDRPEEFRWIGILLDVQEPFQPLDGGNGDDRTEHVQLETAEIALGDALGPIRILANIDPADEIFVAGEDDDQDEVRHEGEIDEVQHADNDFFTGSTLDVLHQLIELDAGLEDEKKYTGQQNEEKRR